MGDTSRLCSPSREEVLTPGSGFSGSEVALFEFLDAHLPVDWEIYLRPHLNGLRPDCIVLSPERGVMVLALIDSWNPEDAADGKYRLHLESHARTRKEIYEVYCPRLHGPSGVREIGLGVVVPKARSENLRRLLQAGDGMGQFEVVAGRDDLKSDVRRVVPRALMDATASDKLKLAVPDLRHWLLEPSFSEDGRHHLQLDAQQRVLATTRAERGYRRIRGPAGTGKSLVLAARAARLAGEGKDVLIVSFNITLLHYLMSLADRCREGPSHLRRRITWINFHAWCLRVCEEAERKLDYDELWGRGDPELIQGEHRQLVLNETMAALAADVLRSDTSGRVSRYDAILVDEGQDFRTQWWGALRLACKPDGEMLLVADLTQDLYETAHNWTEEAMIGSGFRGPWSELRTQHRLPKAVAAAASTFARANILGVPLDLPESTQSELDLGPCTMRWVQTTKDRVAAVGAEEVINITTIEDSDDLAVTDAVFIAASREVGQEVVKVLSTKGYRVSHTFAPGSDGRRQKLAFFLDNARIKATTIQSFKGWESRAVVLHIGDGSSRRAIAGFYAGLTRVACHTKGSYLTVICTNPLFEKDGRAWPAFIRA